jgi:hypothetical protein
MRWTLALVATVGLCSATANHAQSPDRPRYRVLDTNRLTTADLTRAARDGYRVVDGVRMDWDFLVLERSTQTPEYLVADALSQDLRERAIPAGYRILPQSVRTSALTHFRLGPCAAILERAPGDRVVRDYRVEYATSLGNVVRDILKASSEGYRALVLRPGGSGYCAVLERDPAAAGASAPDDHATSPRYELVEALAAGALERAFRQAVGRGYDLHSAFASDAGQLAYFMERRDAGAPVPDYDLVSIPWTGVLGVKRLMDGLNQPAARGYHLHPLSVARASRVARNEIVAVMVRRPVPLVQYGLVWMRASLLQVKADLTAVGEQGWDLVAVIGPRTFLLERSNP